MIITKVFKALVFLRGMNSKLSERLKRLEETTDLALLEQTISLDSVRSCSSAEEISELLKSLSKA